MNLDNKVSCALNSFLEKNPDLSFEKENLISKQFEELVSKGLATKRGNQMMSISEQRLAYQYR